MEGDDVLYGCLVEEEFCLELAIEVDVDASFGIRRAVVVLRFMLSEQAKKIGCARRCLLLEDEIVVCGCFRPFS